MKTILVLMMSLALALSLAGCRGKSDADLQKDVEAAIKTKYPTATVAVKDGVATITGIASDQAAKDAAGVAAKVEGVKSVTNNMTVATPTPVAQMASGNDTEVKTKIDEALKKAGCTGITASVKDGTATLIGTIAEAKYAACIQAVNETKPGKVENKIVKGK